MSITEILIQPQAIAWLPWAVQYFFYIGSAYAAAALFLLALVFHKSTSHQLRSALVLTMAIGAIVGPLALTGDLHQPGRAWHFFFHLTPWSWMSLGSLFLPAFSGLAVITAWLYLRPDLIALKSSDNPLFQLLSRLSLGEWQVERKLMLAVAALTALSGLSIAVYTGAEIAILESRPLWHQPASPLLWYVTAFSGAVGFSLVLWLLLPNDGGNKTLTDGDLMLLRRSALLSGMLGLILIPIWASGHHGALLYDDPRWVAMLGGLTMLLLAGMIIAYMFLRTAGRSFGLWLSALTLLAGCWTTRWITMMETQTIAKFDAGSYPYEIPLGSNGLLGIAGILGLWLALAMLGTELVSNPQTRSKH